MGSIIGNSTVVPHIISCIIRVRGIIAVSAIIEDVVGHIRLCVAYRVCSIDDIPLSRRKAGSPALLDAKKITIKPPKNRYHPYDYRT